MALDQETIFYKVLNAISKKLNDHSKYSIDKVLESINEILTIPFSIVNGYDQMIKQIDTHYFGFLDNSNKYVKNKNYDLLKNEKVNDFDKLNGPQRIAVKSIIYESLIYFNDLSLDEKGPYNYLNNPKTTSKTRVSNLIESIIYRCSTLFKELNPNVYVIALKKYTISNKEREINFENEKCYYINSIGKLEEAKIEEISENEKDCVLPNVIGKAYLVSNYTITVEDYKNNDIMLFVTYKDGTFEIINDLNNLNVKNPLQAVHSCNQVYVYFADVNNPNYNPNSGERKQSRKYLEMNRNGKYYLDGDEQYIEYFFDRDKITRHKYKC